MHRTIVLLVVGLTGELVGEATPSLAALAREGACRPLRTILPAVTCSVQSTLVTGLLPRDHGVVANGWYFRDLAEVWLWRQSNRLVAGEKVWEAAFQRDPAFTCAKLFWWYNMHSAATWSVTPRPMYPADGRKIPDVYTQPAELRDELNARLGQFPLFRFWGPATDLAASRWIADCARHVYDTKRPTLTLVYLPHLDYNLQRLGPGHPAIAQDLRAVDALCGELIAHARRDGTRVVVLSEYGITPVTGAIHVNRALREAGLIRVRTELGLELLDPGASEAFAVADHQIAHVYVRRPERVPEVKRLLEGLPGVERVLDADGKRAAGLDHPRSGELVALARADRWFTLLLLAGRRPRAGLRADGRHPPEAGLRPGGAVPGPRASGPQGAGRLAARQEGPRLPVPDGRDPPRREPRQGLARPPDRRPERGPARHLERAGSPPRRPDRRDRGQGSPPRPRVRALTRALGMAVR